MAKLRILEFPDPRLRKKAAPVEVVDDALRQLIDDMFETMYEAPGIGLAATQVDVHQRLLVADVSQDKTEPLVLINPQILEKNGSAVTEEGCLSVPGYYEEVERAGHIKVRYLGRDGNEQESEFEDLLAVCVQHEMDHLEGKLFVDYLSEVKRQRIRKRLEKDRRQLGVGNDSLTPQLMTAAKFLFAGTPDFALESLRALYAAGYVPAAVLTQPDRPAGRGKKLTESPVKQFASRHNIPVWQPETLKDADIVAQIAETKPDLIIVAAYGLLLPQAVLDMPTRGCVNVHASLLPRWRGAAPVQAAILEGDSETGITLMQMEAGLDSGPVLASASINIDADETAGSLRDRLAALGGDLLVQELNAILEGSLDAVPQDDEKVTYAGKIRKQDSVIDWSCTAEQIGRQIRAYDPVPGASFKLDGEVIKCWKAETVAGGEGPVGTILSADKHGVDVACSGGALRMLEIQRPGRRRVTAAEFSNQIKLTGKRFG